MPDPEVDAFGRRVIHLFETSDSSGIAAAVDPSLTTQSDWAQIVDVGDTLAAFHRDSTALVGSNTFRSTDSYRADLTYELRGQGWMLVTIALTRHQGALVATGFHIQRMAASLADLNAFTLRGRGWRHYLVLALAFGCFLICLVSSVLVFRTPMRRRWLWTLAALLGVGQFGINWSTGETFINPLRFQLFCAAYFRPGLVGPWLISFAIPIGAALALWRRHQFLTSRERARVPTAAA